VKPLVGECREPLIVLILALTVLLPVLALLDASETQAFAVGLGATVGCCSVGVLRISRSNREQS